MRCVFACNAQFNVPDCVFGCCVESTINRESSGAVVAVAGGISGVSERDTTDCSSTIVWRG